MYYGNDGRVAESRRYAYLTAFIQRDEMTINQLQMYSDEPQVKATIRELKRRIAKNCKSLQEM